MTDTHSMTSSQAYPQPQLQLSEASSPCSYSEAVPGNCFLPANIGGKPAADSHSAPDSECTDFPAVVPASGMQTISHLVSLSVQGKQKKKVGRPIAYKGDPSAPNLTEVERRRIKRRIANRESARRVRARRQETLEELQIKMDQINMHNAEMVRHIAEVEGHSALLKGQLQECEMQWNKAIADNARLHQQVTLLNSQAHEQAKHATKDVMLPSSENINKRNTPAGDQHFAGAYRAAPVTGISCELIEELPTMALPFSEGMLLSGLYDEECPILL